MTGGALPERQAGVLGPVGGTQPAAGQLRHVPPGAQRRLHRPGEHRRGALAQHAARVAHRVQAAGLAGDQDAAGAAQAVPDGDLAGVDGVEPGERLVGADVQGAFRPQVLQLPLTELEPAGGIGGDHPDPVLRRPGRVQARVPQHLGGTGQRELCDAVGLGQQAAGQVLAGVACDLAGQPARVAGGVEAGDRADAAASLQQAPPELLGAVPVGRPHVEAGHQGRAPPGSGCRGRGCGGGHRRVPSGRVSTMALWKPPKPLPTVRTASRRCSLAVTGT